MGYLLPILIGYLLGCSSMAYYIGKWKKKDPRTGGSGNLGASNTAVLFGWGAGITVALHDIAKGVVAVLVVQKLFSAVPYAGAAAGVACVLGHIFPFYLKFKGGKGLASYFGMTLALNWKLALIAAVTIVLLTLITDYISVGTFGTIFLVPTYTAITTHNLMLTLILCIASAVMVYKHWENVVRIATGKEIGLRSTAKGENRVDKK